jgi:hypothetical protein
MPSSAGRAGVLRRYRGEASKQLAESLKGGKHAPVFFHCDLTDLKALSRVIAQSRKTTARLKS